MGMVSGRVDRGMQLVEFREVAGQQCVLFEVIRNRPAECGLGTLPQVKSLFVLTAQLPKFCLLWALLGAGSTRRRYTGGASLWNWNPLRTDANRLALTCLQVEDPLGTVDAVDRGNGRVQHQQGYTLDQFFASAISS